MKNLMAAVAFGLCAFASVEYATLVAAAGSTITSRNSTSVTNSVTSSTSSNVQSNNSTIVSNNGSTVSSSTDVGGTSSTVTNSVVGRNSSMCSAEFNGRRCHVKCRLPKVAQCGQTNEAMKPVCACQ